MIVDNGSLGQIPWEQMVLSYPEHGVRFQQATKGFAQAWLRGQPRRATIASTLLSDKIEQLRK